MNIEQGDVRRVKALAGAAYAISAMLIVIPLMEVGSELGWTAQPRVLNWRTGAVGMLSGATLTPILGLFVAIVTATVMGHRWVQRGLGILAGIGGVAMLAILGLFALDALQLRPNVAAPMKRAFDVAIIRAVFSLTVGGATLLLLAFGSRAVQRKAARTGAERGKDSNRDNSPLIRATQPH